MLRDPLVVTPTVPIPSSSFPHPGYVSLAFAIGFEVGGTLCMGSVQKSEWWRVPAYIFYGVAFSLFPWIVQEVPLAIAYATWSAVGSAAVAVISALFFNEGLTTLQGVAIGGIVSSIFLLHLG